MKKAIYVLVAVLGLTAATQAQERAIGIRGAFGTASGAELSFQMPNSLIGNNRLELDLGWYGGEDWNHIGLTGICQWDWNLTGGLNWYVGPGVQLGVYTGNETKIGVAVGGQIGLEYNFSFPLQISLDVRPMWHLLGSHTGFGYGAALGFRWRF